MHDFRGTLNLLGAIALCNRYLAHPARKTEKGERHKHEVLMAALVDHITESCWRGLAGWLDVRRHRGSGGSLRVRVGQALRQERQRRLRRISLYSAALHPGAAS